MNWLDAPIPATLPELEHTDDGNCHTGSPAASPWLRLQRYPLTEMGQGYHDHLGESAAAVSSPARQLQPAHSRTLLGHSCLRASALCRTMSGSAGVPTGTVTFTLKAYGHLPVTIGPSPLSVVWLPGSANLSSITANDFRPARDAYCYLQRDSTYQSVTTLTRRQASCGTTTTQPIRTRTAHTH